MRTTVLLGLSGVVMATAIAAQEADCVACHEKETPGIVADWRASSHSIVDLDCSGCHGAEHVTAEYRVRTEGRGRSVDEWKMRADRTDNHWLDCLVGCAVAASMQGCSLMGEADPEPVKRSRVSFAEMQRSKRR